MIAEELPRPCTRAWGEAQEERILAAVADEALSMAEIARELDMHMESVRVYIHRLRSGCIKHLHIACYEPNLSGRPTPYFRYGNKPDAVFQVKTVRKPKQPDRVAAKLQQAELLLAEPMTSGELGIALNIGVSRARMYIKELREDGKVFIKGWRHPGGRGDLAPLYMAGKRKDAIKPQESRSARYKKEISDPDRHERILAKKRAEYRAEAAASTPGNWLSALGL